MAELFLTWFLVFVRAGAMLAFFPIFSAAAMPVRLRIAIAGFLALFSLSGVSLPENLVTSNLIGAIGMVGQEVFYGLMLGFVVRLVLFDREVVDVGAKNMKYLQDKIIVEEVKRPQTTKTLISAKTPVTDDVLKILTANKVSQVTVNSVREVKEQKIFLDVMCAFLSLALFGR